MPRGAQIRCLFLGVVWECSGERSVCELLGWGKRMCPQQCKQASLNLLRLNTTEGRTMAFSHSWTNLPPVAPGSLTLHQNCTNSYPRSPAHRLQVEGTSWLSTQLLIILMFFYLLLVLLLQRILMKDHESHRMEKLRMRQCGKRLARSETDTLRVSVT